MQTKPKAKTNESDLKRDKEVETPLPRRPALTRTPNEQRDRWGVSRGRPGDDSRQDAAKVADPTINVRVEAKSDETADQLLRRFGREVMRAGVIQRLRELEFYERPSQKRKRELREKYEESRRRRFRRTKI